MAVQAHATAKYVRTSAQKAGLVMDLIRGRNVNHALATLKFARKGVARDIEKVLRSAIANATQKDGFGGDVERLFVNACYANQGPSQKRIRPAPMGRAFRVVKRTAHLTVQVAEQPSKVVETAEPAAGAPKRPRGAAPKRPKAAKTGARPKAKSAAKAGTKKTGAKKTSARKTTAKSRAKAATEK
jgi:large subunit ribosomal protein L22